MGLTPHHEGTAHLPDPSVRDRRRYARVAASDRLLLQWIECDECQEQVSRAEDVSPGGALLIVDQPIPQGETVLVQGWHDAPFVTRAEVCRVYIGRDGRTRLAIRFLDGERPER